MRSTAITVTIAVTITATVVFIVVVVVVVLAVATVVIVVIVPITTAINVGHSRLKLSHPDEIGGVISLSVRQLSKKTIKTYLPLNTTKSVLSVIGQRLSGVVVITYSLGTAERN